MVLRSSTTYDCRYQEQLKRIYNFIVNMLESIHCSSPTTTLIEGPQEERETEASRFKSTSTTVSHMAGR